MLNEKQLLIPYHLVKKTMILWLLVSQNMSEQMTFHDFCEAVSSLTEFTVIYLLFHTVKGKKTKDKTCNHKKRVLCFQAGGRLEVCFKLQAEDSVIKDHSVTMQIL